jgi:PHD/YefM family antitoxin component YafN of YafNO toxin-antitoxin module
MTAMTKPKYVLDDMGNKVEVILPVADYEALLEELEDAHDYRIVTERRAENSQPVSLEDMKRKLGL